MDEKRRSGLWVILHQKETIDWEFTEEMLAVDELRETEFEYQDKLEQN